MKIGMVGAGAMGGAMAQNLKKNGIDLVVYCRAPERYSHLSQAGIPLVTSLDKIADCGVICLCLPDGEIVREIMYNGGIIDKLHKGQIIVDFSTIDYETTIKLSADISAKEARLLDAPISGMEEGARDGTLTIMCGGEEELFEHMLPLLRYLGKEILYLGKTGNGQLGKLVNQILYDINAAALAEVLPLAIKLGLEPEKVGKIVTTGSSRSYASQRFVPRILKGDFDRDYPMDSAYKDFKSAFAVSVGSCVPMPLMSAAALTYQTAMLQGMGRLGKGAMIRVYEELLGVEFRGE